MSFGTATPINDTANTHVYSDQSSDRLQYHLTMRPVAQTQQLHCGSSLPPRSVLHSTVRNVTRLHRLGSSARHNTTFGPRKHLTTGLAKQFSACKAAHRDVSSSTESDQPVLVTATADVAHSRYPWRQLYTGLTAAALAFCFFQGRALAAAGSPSAPAAIVTSNSSPASSPAAVRPLWYRQKIAFQDAVPYRIMQVCWHSNRVTLWCSTSG